MYVEGGAGDNLGQGTEIMDPNIDKTFNMEFVVMQRGKTVNFWQTDSTMSSNFQHSGKL